MYDRKPKTLNKPFCDVITSPLYTLSSYLRHLSWFRQGNTMSWNDFFTEPISCFILTLLAMTSLSDGTCRNLYINTVMQGKALVNHTVGIIQPVDNKETCGRRCYLEQLCFTFNYCERPSSGSWCELLNSDHIRHGDDLVDKTDCTYYGSETACSSNPCVGDATCQGDFSMEDKPYRCVCPQGITGQNCEIGRKSCEDLKPYLQTNAVTGFYDHEIEGGGVAKVFCSYESNFECGTGPWTLVMKIDGSKNNFKHDSIYWGQKTVFNRNGSLGGLDDEETVSPAYWSTPLTKLCLGMKYEDELKWILIEVNATSLYDIMANQTPVTTHLGEAKWRSLLAKTSLEDYCNMEGFNLRCERENYKNRKLRLGFFANNGNDCTSCTSYVGLGPVVNSNSAPSCGNYGTSNGDNGNLNIAAFCYILVQ